MNETNLSPRMAMMSTRAVSLAWRALQPRPRERRGAVNFEMESGQRPVAVSVAGSGNDGRATRNRPASWSASLQPIGRRPSKPKRWSWHSPAALTRFRARAAERTDPVITPGSDGMRSCVDCLNLSPGGRWSRRFARRLVRFPMPGNYAPTMMDRPQRCAPYKPGPNDLGRRTSAERWPRLLEFTS